MERKHKMLIFSQMTRLLDIIGDYLGQVKELRFSRLDGSMAFEDRQANIDAFNETDDVRVFLLSTRAGGLGINLTAADTCIIYDSDWNPQQDLQVLIDHMCYRYNRISASGRQSLSIQYVLHPIQSVITLYLRIDIPQK